MIKNENKVRRLLEDSNYLISSNKGVGIVGNTYEVMTCLVMLISHLIRNNIIDEKKLNEIIKLAKMSDKELLEEAQNCLNNIKNKIEE